ncbi:hypothetical protein [Methanosarcina barkeri]|nr:hypothetical protein [Methanosarcina barkeri]
MQAITSRFEVHRARVSSRFIKEKSDSLYIQISLERDSCVAVAKMLAVC